MDYGHSKTHLGQPEDTMPLGTASSVVTKRLTLSLKKKQRVFSYQRTWECPAYPPDPLVS